MKTFVKLSSTLLDSSVWDLDHATRILWITLLVMKDYLGEVHSSLPGLAMRARINIHKAKKGLTLLLSDDPYSRNKNFSGRRIEEIEGGWRVLGHEHYRMQSYAQESSERSRNYRERKKLQTEAISPSRSRHVTGVTRHVTNVTECDIVTPVTYTDTVLKTMSSKGSTKAITEKTPEEEAAIAEAEARVRAALRIKAIEVIDYLNFKTERDFQHVDSNIKMISARLREVGENVDEVKKLIDSRVAAWNGDEKMQEFLRPATLFAERNFANYYGQRNMQHGTAQLNFTANLHDPAVKAAALRAALG